MPCTRQILIVEDDDAFRIPLGDVFARTCGSVLLARDGLEALDLLQTGAAAPCVIITDIDMPRMGGAEFIATLASRGLGHVPIITMSGTQYVPSADGVHLQKPFDWKDLSRAVVRCAGCGCALRNVVSEKPGA